MASVKEETARGIKWGLIQKCTMQPVQFLYGIILARLISPAEMGILGLTSIFFALAMQLQQCGFGTALMRKQERTDEDICTVFWFNVAMSLILSTLLFLAAPWFAAFFNQPALINLTRVSALLMFLNSTVSVHMTLYQARREFKPPAIVSMCTTLVAMPFTIWAAYAGWSYWAPMLQGILTGVLTFFTIWIISPWKPRFCFSFASFREFFRYGSYLVLSGITGLFYTESRTFIIGKFYSPAQLAFFSKSQQLCSMPYQLATSILSPVTFPIMATLQHDQSRLVSVFRQYARLTALVIVWGMVTLAANASSLVVFLYGEKWATAAIYAQIICFGWMFNPLMFHNANLFAILGRTDLNFKTNIVLYPLCILVMILCAFHSVKAICYAAIFSGAIQYAVTSILVARISPIRIFQIAADFFPYLFMAILANVPAYIIDHLSWPSYYRLAAGGLSSICLYLLMLSLKQDATAAELFNFLRSKLHKGKL